MRRSQAPLLASPLLTSPGGGRAGPARPSRPSPPPQVEPGPAGPLLPRRGRAPAAPGGRGRPVPSRPVAGQRGAARRRPPSALPDTGIGTERGRVPGGVPLQPPAPHLRSAASLRGSPGTAACCPPARGTLCRERGSTLLTNKNNNKTRRN